MVDPNLDLIIFDTIWHRTKGIPHAEGPLGGPLGALNSVSRRPNTTPSRKSAFYKRISVLSIAFAPWGAQNATCMTIFFLSKKKKVFGSCQVNSVRPTVQKAMLKTEILL